MKLVHLARLADLDHSTISHWMSGRNDLSTDSLSKILEAAEQLSPGSLIEFGFLLSYGGLQNENQLADILDMVAFEYRRIKDKHKEKVCV